jgi:hypothetical protein
MLWFQNIYKLLNSIFEILTFRTKPECDVINDIDNNYDEYEFVMLHNKIKKSQY